MRNHRLFGVVIAVLLGISFLHQSPSSPHHDQQQIARHHFGGTGIQLTAARVSADPGLTPLALGEESPVGLLGPSGTAPTLGPIRLASADVPPPQSEASMAEGDGAHIGLLRPAGTRYVKSLIVWMAYEREHPPPPPPPPPAPKPVPVVVVAHHAVAVTPKAPVAPATSAAGGSAASGGVWASLRQCESGGNYADNTGNGYYGAYQFALGTWHGLGYSGLPSAASPVVCSVPRLMALSRPAGPPRDRIVPVTLPAWSAFLTAGGHPLPTARWPRRPAPRPARSRSGGPAGGPSPRPSRCRPRRGPPRPPSRRR